MRIGRVLLPLLALSSLPAAPASRDTHTFPPLYNTERNPVAAPMPPAAAAAGFKLPPGFKATVFAAEPDVQNPIAMAWDGRGRLWVAENYTYAESPRKFDLGLRDRILIFEDSNGDGRFDSRNVFTDERADAHQHRTRPRRRLADVPAAAAFHSDRDRNDMPDGPPEVVLDGFTPPPKTTTPSPTACDGDPMAGSTAAAAPRAPAASACRARRGGAGSRARQALAVSSATQALRSAQPWHDQPVGSRLGRAWRAVLHQHGQRPSLARHPRRALSPAPHTIDPNPRVYALIDQHADHWHFDTGKVWQDRATPRTASAAATPTSA